MWGSITPESEDRQNGDLCVYGSLRPKRLKASLDGGAGRGV